LSSDGLRVALGRVYPGANGRRAHVDLQNQLLGLAQAVDVFEDGMGEGTELLPERHRYGVLKLRAAHLDEGAELFAFLQKCPSERGHRRLQLGNARVQRQLDRRGIDVVGRLAQIDVVVRVDNVVRATRKTQRLQGEVGDHLVRVHVGRGPGAPLNHVDRKLVAVLPAPESLRGRNNGARNFRVQQAQLLIRQRRRLLDGGERRDQGRKLADVCTGNWEILQCAERLHAVQGVCWYAALAK